MFHSSAVGAVSVQDQLFVCGGFDGISSLDTVEKFDPDGNKWNMVSAMTKHRSAAGKAQIVVEPCTEDSEVTYKAHLEARFNAHNLRGPALVHMLVKIGFCQIRLFFCRKESIFA